jgi:acetylglutamate kinase
MERMGKKPTFVSGQRVTDEETMDIVEMVLGGKVNKEIVNLINRTGGKAVGLTGKDGGLIQAKKLKMTIKSENTGETEIIDIGLVGEVTEVRPGALVALEQGGFIPVIAPVGVGENGETYNINADLVAGAVAGALKAEKLILLTDQSGILDKDKNLIPTLNKKTVETMIHAGVIAGGMIPKTKSCSQALDAGCSKVHIIDGRIPHALLLEIFTREGIGTEITL